MSLSLHFQLSWSEFVSSTLARFVEKFVCGILLCTGWWHCIELYQHNDLLMVIIIENIEQ